MIARLLVPLIAFCLAGGSAEAPDLRGVELLDFDCVNAVGRRQVTLFANGTLRLRQGPPGEEIIELTELAPDEVDAFVRRLAAESLSETREHTPGVEGEWIDRCRLELALPDRQARQFTFDGMASLSLGLSRVVAIARELAERAEETAVGDRHLPSGYEPRPGDVLERFDGSRYRIVGFTVTRRGVELQGIDQPLTLYVYVDDLPREFVAVVSRR